MRSHILATAREEGFAASTFEQLMYLLKGGCIFFDDAQLSFIEYAVFWEEFLKQGGRPKVVTAATYTMNAALDTPGEYANRLVYNLCLDHERMYKERIKLGWGRYYGILVPGGLLTSRQVELLKRGSQQVAPESTSEYRVSFEDGFHCARLVRGGKQPTSPPSCGCAPDDNFDVAL
jgi:hypothetical protein